MMTHEDGIDDLAAAWIIVIVFAVLLVGLGMLLW